MDGDQTGCGVNAQEAIFVESRSDSGAALRAVYPDPAAADPAGGLLKPLWDFQRARRGPEGEGFLCESFKKRDQQRLAGDDLA
jgi:hypothetical protein